MEGLACDLFIFGRRSFPFSMSIIKKSLLLLLLPLFAFTAAHKFYLSVTHIDYSEKDQALQITSRIFIDDLDAVLLERYDINGQLATEKESSLADEYIEKYIRTKFRVQIDGNARDFDFIGRKYEDDLIICYLEVPGVILTDQSTITVQNEMLIDLFDEQQNVVHFKIKGKKKSFVLIKESNKGMLNL